jgi:hypothetical protein
MEMFPLLKNFWTLCEPKSVGASQHPDKGVCHFGSHFLAMSARSESILDHIADYLRFFSTAQLYWFMLNMSHNYDCHLANQFCFGPEDYYEVLLIVARLALYTQLRQHGERQCNNQPDKRHKRGAVRGSGAMRGGGAGGQGAAA